MPGTPLHVLLDVPPQAGRLPVLGTEGQEGCPEFFVLSCHCDSFLAARPAERTPGLLGARPLRGPLMTLASRLPWGPAREARGAAVPPTAAVPRAARGPGLHLVQCTVIVHRTT